MSKKVKTVAVHSRILETDAVMLDRAAADEPTTRSKLIARLIREWAKSQKPVKGKGTP